jgi:maleylacetoacetate isomerase
MKLYTYHRNSAGERVRIALNIKGLPYEYVSVPALGWDAYRTINPQGLMPALEIGGHVVAQSAAILELLEERYPEPRLLPADPLLRADARAFGQLIACDLHPLNNSRVHRYLETEIGVAEAERQRWYRHWVAVGFTALETALERRREQWPFCFGEQPGWADLHLVPQMRNARRFECDLEPFPRLRAVDDICVGLDVFRRAHPLNQPDFPPPPQV